MLLGNGGVGMKIIMWVLLIAAWLLSGCTTFRDVAYWPPHQPEALIGKAWLTRIEVSEHGPIFHEEQFANVESTLAKGDSNDPIIVFVHGWHHNASRDDENLEGFGDFLGKLDARLAADGVKVGRIDGIYVGWRGDAYDLIIPGEWLDFPTIWSRKAASKRVGENGLQRIVDTLQRNAINRPVVVVGHSLGGYALYSAVERDLSGMATDGFEYIMLNPAVSELEMDDLGARLKVELARYGVQRQRLAPVEALGTGPRPTLLDDRPYRKLVVLQSMGDTAVGILHRFAFSGTPVGFSKEKRTHTARLCGPSNPCPAYGQSACLRTVPLRVPEGRTGLLLTARGDTDVACDKTNSEPLWVIAGNETVSRDHNDILNDVQADALAGIVSDSVREQMQYKARATR